MINADASPSRSLARRASSGTSSESDRVVTDVWLAGFSAVVGLIAFAISLTPETLANSANRSGILVACGSILIGLWFARALGGAIHALSPLAVVAYCQFLLFLARPTYQYFEADGLNAFTASAYGPSFVVASFVAGIGFFAICVGYSVVVGKTRQTMPLQRLPPVGEAEWMVLQRALVAVVVIGFLIYSVYVMQVGVGNFFSGVSEGRSELSRRSVVSASGYLTSGLQFSIGALILLTLGNRVRGRGRLALVSMSVLLVALYPDIAGGNRSVFIPVAVAIVLTLFTTNARVLSPVRLLIFVPVAFVLGIVAPRLWRDQLAQGGSLLDSLLSAFNPTVAIEGFVGGLDTAMVDAFEAQVQAQSSGVLNFQYGTTYIGALGAAIPRNLWPSKPESVDQILNAALFPALDALGIGFSFGFYSEPYFNFGFAGVVVVSLFFGVFLGWITRRLHGRRTLLDAYIFIMVTAYIFPIMRGSLSFDGQRLLIAALPALFAMLFAMRRLRLLSLRRQVRLVRIERRAQSSIGPPDRVGPSDRRSGA